MTTTNKLREKINAACPKLKEPCFGCEVIVQNYISHVIILQDRRGWTYIPESGEPYCDFMGFAHTPCFFDERHITKILGTPPTLEHLMRAVWFAISQLRTRRRVPHKRIRRIEEELGGMLGFTAGDEELWWELCEEDGVMYDFRKSPLDQSQEVQEALVELLS